MARKTRTEGIMKKQGGAVIQHHVAVHQHTVIRLIVMAGNEEAGWCSITASCGCAPPCSDMVNSDGWQ